MSNEFRGIGNAGDQPAMKTVMVGTSERRIAELRVFFDDYRQDGKGGVEQTGGFWLDVNVWDERQAADVVRIVKKGARVHVIGRLAEHRRSAFYLNADALFLGLGRIAEISFRPRM
jgi:single-stranded DNA-binding protein